MCFCAIASKGIILIEKICMNRVGEKSLSSHDKRIEEVRRYNEINETKI